MTKYQLALSLKIQNQKVYFNKKHKSSVGRKVTFLFPISYQGPDRERPMSMKFTPYSC